jgi:type III restriction enzyme
MAECLSCVPGTFPAYLLWRDVGDKAAERIYRACMESKPGRASLRPIMDPYNEQGSSRYVALAQPRRIFGRQTRASAR